MKHVKTIDDIIKHEKRYCREYDIDYTTVFEQNLRSELEKLFDEFFSPDRFVLSVVYPQQ